MSCKSTKSLKWWFIIVSIIVVFEEVVFQQFSRRWPSSTSFMLGRIQREDNDENAGMRARRLLGDGVNSTQSDSSGLSSNTASRLPTCIIIGARKCGTRALLEFLEIHPKILISPDEMHFFSNDSHYVKGLEWYRSRMPVSSADQITIEKTPRYFVSRTAPARVRAMNPRIKLIVILRQPTTRVISDYTQIHIQRHNRNETTRSIESLAIDNRTGQVNVDYKAVQISVYHRHVSRWLEHFPLAQVHIVDGDGLIKNPISEIHKVETFLGLQHEISPDAFYYNKTRGFYCMHRSGSKHGRCLGASKGRKHVYISDWVRRKLNNYFKPHNEVLFKIVKRRFHWR